MAENHKLNILAQTTNIPNNDKKQQNPYSGASICCPDIDIDSKILPKMIENNSYNGTPKCCPDKGQDTCSYNDGNNQIP